MANKVKFKVVKSNFQDLVDKLEDLTKIDDKVKFKIDNENILIYSAQGTIAFKSYLVPTKDYFEYKDDIDYTLDIVIVNAKKFVKNLSFLMEHDVTIEVSYKEDQDFESNNIMNSRAIQVSGGKLKVNWLSGEHYEVRKVDKNVLKKMVNVNNRKWFFSINKSDYSDIKKLSNINSDRVISINVNDGRVIFSEKSAWELEIDSIEDFKSYSLILNKKFLNCINDNNIVEFSIFENFMLVNNENSNLILSFEQSFDDE